MSVDDVCRDGVVQRLDVVGQERPMSLKGGFVAAACWSGLSFSGVALKSALCQAQHQVAQQGLRQAALFKKVLRFGEHVVRKVSATAAAMCAAARWVPDTSDTSAFHAEASVWASAIALSSEASRTVGVLARDAAALGLKLRMGQTTALGARK